MKRKRLFSRARTALLLITLCAAPVRGADPAPPFPAEPWQAQIQAMAARDGRDDILHFYVRRQFLPVWTEAGRVAELLRAIEDLTRDGLDPGEYGLNKLRDGLGERSSGLLHPDSCFELEATRAYLDALHHLHFGRLDRQKVEPIWRSDPEIDRAERERRIAGIADAGLNDIPAAFAAARPRDQGYEALRTAYGVLHARVTSPGARDWIPLPSGPALRPGATDARVLILRRLLAGRGESAAAGDGADPATYDDELAEAVRRFQSTHHLVPDAVVGRATIAALNVSPEDALARLRVNLERARWRARDMEAEMVLVDIAAARITYLREGVAVWSARTQVGRSSRPTPILKSGITHFTFNPTWTVPPTILRKDKLPEIRRDVAYLERNRIRVLDRSGLELDPASIDWDQPGAILLRQDAGPENALGQVAIRFPNRFFVYLHDTPSQSQFERDARNFSSGCVRVERALELVGLLMSDTGTHDGIERYLSDGRTRNVPLQHPVPILIDYWTAHVDDAGAVSFRPDVYHHDARVLQALDTAHLERPPPSACTACPSATCDTKTSSSSE
jgi:murein L,D-transpeptidase YcbB/YkuD